MDATEPQFPEVVQKDLPCKLLGTSDNNEIDVTTNMNNSAAITNNFEVVLSTTQQKRSSRKISIVSFLSSGSLLQGGLAYLFYFCLANCRFVATGAFLFL